MNMKTRILTIALTIASALTFGASTQAQTVVTSSYTLDVSGTAPAVKTGLPESVNFAGPVVVTSVVTRDPSLGLGAAVSVNGLSVKGTGLKTGKTYLNECEASLTRPFGATDTITLTFAFFEDAPGSYMTSKTGVLTLTLTYDTTTLKLTKVTGSVGTL